MLWHATRDDATGFEWVLPSGGPQLIVPLDGRPARWTDASGEHTVAGAAIGGPFLAPVGVRAEDQCAVAGALFRPGGLAALLRVPVRALVGTYAGVDELWGRETGRWVDAVRRASSAEAALVALERGLGRHLRSDGAWVGLSAACRALGRGDRVRDVADALGVVQRRFSTQFTDQLGLTPKQFTRVQRFQRALQHLSDPRAGLDLAEVAFSAGYYDQAHFNREFRALAGRTPGAYRAARRPFLRHVEIDEASGAHPR